MEEEIVEDDAVEPLDPEKLELNIIRDGEGGSPEPAEGVVAKSGGQIIRASSAIFRTDKGVVHFKNIILATETEMVMMHDPDNGVQGMVPNPLRRYAAVLSTDGGSSQVDFFNLDKVTQITLRDAK